MVRCFWVDFRVFVFVSILRYMVVDDMVMVLLMRIVGMGVRLKIRFVINDIVIVVIVICVVLRLKICFLSVMSFLNENFRLSVNSRSIILILLMLFRVVFLVIRLRLVGLMIMLVRM